MHALIEEAREQLAAAVPTQAELDQVETSVNSVGPGDTDRAIAPD